MPEALQIARVVMIIVEAVLAVALVVSIFFQPANTTGVSAIDNTQTYYIRNKTRTTEGFMKRATVVIAILMAAIAVAFFITLCFNNPPADATA